VNEGRKRRKKKKEEKEGRKSGLLYVEGVNTHHEPSTDEQ